MKLNKLNSLRIKLTIMSSLILIAVSFVLAFSSNFFSTRTIRATNLSEVFDLSSTISSSSGLEFALRSSNTQTNMVMVGLIILGTVLTYYFSGKILKNLENFTKKVNDMTIDELSHDIILNNSNDEVMQLVDAFNKMTNKISDTYLMQKNFSANVAHELRTPLTSLQTKIEVFKMTERNFEQYDKLLFTIEENTKKLTSIVNVLLQCTNNNLDYSKFMNFNLEYVIQEVLENLNPLKKKKEITIDFNSKSLFVKSDKDLIKQVFFNLLENAIKYNKEGGSVVINMYEGRNHINVEIIDNGIGISNEDKKFIFEPFFQVNKSGNTKVVGSGLGLFIVKNILNNLDSKIKITDNSPKGTCFLVKIKKF